MNEIELKIKGMMCGGCENRVKNALENIDGVENVSANHTTGVVNVVCNERITKQVLEETIEDLGFSIVGD